MRSKSSHLCFLPFFLCAYKIVTDEDEEEINPDIFKVKRALLVRIKLSKVGVCTKRGKEDPVSCELNIYFLNEEA